MLEDVPSAVQTTAAEHEQHSGFVEGDFASASILKRIIRRTDGS